MSFAALERRVGIDPVVEDSVVFAFINKGMKPLLVLVGSAYSPTSVGANDDGYHLVFRDSIDSHMDCFYVSIERIVRVATIFGVV